MLGTTQLTALCSVDDVTADAPARVLADGTVVAVFRIGDRIYAVQDACTHGPGSLADGYVDGEDVECPFHQGRFHIPTGAPAAPPCTIPLRTWDVRIIDGQVCIDLSQKGGNDAPQGPE